MRRLACAAGLHALAWTIVGYDFQRQEYIVRCERCTRRV